MCFPTISFRQLPSYRLKLKIPCLHKNANFPCILIKIFCFLRQLNTLCRHTLIKICYWLFSRSVYRTCLPSHLTKMLKTLTKGKTEILPFYHVMTETHSVFTSFEVRRNRVHSTCTQMSLKHTRQMMPSQLTYQKHDAAFLLKKELK